MPTKGKYAEWLRPEKLEQVTNWAANGLYNKEIAQNIGIHIDTFCTWQNRFPEFSEAIEKGRRLSVQAIENKFFQNAYGMLEEVVEIVEEDQVFEGGEWVSKRRHVRRTTKKVPPNTAAQIFFLKNKAGYSDKPVGDVDVEDSGSFFAEAGLDA